MKKKLYFTTVLIVLTLCIIAGTSGNGEAVERALALGNYMWHEEGGSTLTLDHPQSSPNDLRVTSTAAGDLKWIDAAIPINFGGTVKLIAICYQTPNAGTSIVQVRLSEYILKTATVLIDLSPIAESSAGTCYVSPPLNLTADGALVMSLRLKFASASDSIAIGATAILLDE